MIETLEVLEMEVAAREVDARERAVGSSRVLAAETGAADRTEQAKIAKVKQDFNAIQQASNLFRNDQGRWPDTLEELMNPPEPEDGISFDYIENADPADPWTGDLYHYEVTDEGVLLISYGADRTEGGTGINADIRSDEVGRSRR